MPALANVGLADVERELAELRKESPGDTTPAVRMSTMTHLAWVPPEWLDQAVSTLHGMGERHPSRTILLVPQANEPESRLDADVEVERFPLSDRGRHVCAEVVVLHLSGRRALAPASVVQPLLISDLPVFLRWRGEPPWSTPPFEQLVDIVDRLVVDSSEWHDLPFAYEKLAAVFGRTSVSDIAWARTLEWRRALACFWPAIAEARRVRVEGPLACALLLHGWLRERLGTDIDLEHEEAAPDIRLVALDGEPVPGPRGDPPTASDLLSDELDRYTRDPVYERAAAQAGSSAP